MLEIKNMSLVPALWRQELEDDWGMVVTAQANSWPPKQLRKIPKINLAYMNTYTRGKKQETKSLCVT